MAAIGRIRKHSALLIAIIGIALLAFVLGDLFKGNNRHEYNIAVVDGEKINQQDYNNQFDKNLVNYKRNSQTNNVSTAQNYSLHNSTLENMIKNVIMSNEYDALGMQISSDELYDQFMGDEPHQWVVQSFTDGNGQFDKANVQNYLQNIDNFPAENKAQWLEFENAVREDRLENKYNNLVKASYFVPTKLAAKYNQNKNEKASADVIAVRYSSIPDSTVVVTDKDKKAFYEENKSKFETVDSRDIEYVVFDVKPSPKDYQDAQTLVQDLKADFGTTENVTNFVNANSDARYDSTWKNASQLPATLEPVVFGGENAVGFVYGPYLDNNAYNLARIMDLSHRSDSLMASHILIAYKGAYNSADTVRTKEEAEALAQSLAKEMKNINNNSEAFAAKAKELSDDPGSKEKGGDLGWFTDGQMVPAFNEFVQNNSVGTIGVVETPFGFHVIKVTDKNAAQPVARVAILTHEVFASTETYQNVFAVANKFVTENRTYAQFNEAIEKDNLTKRTYPNLTNATYQITGVENPRPIVRWAFDSKTKEGDISTIFDLDNMFVVAALTKVIPEGYAPMDVVLERSKYQLINKKKGEMIVDKMKAYGNDYDKLVSELGGETQNVKDVSMDSRSFGNFGVESEVIGKVLGMSENEVSEPIAGNSSAFIIKNVKIQKAADNGDYSDIMKEKTSQFNNQVINNSVYSALRDKADIEDNRVIFY